MRILFLTNFYPPHDIGGYEQSCNETVDLLLQRGHQAVVLTSNWRKLGELDQDDGMVRRELYLDADLKRYDPIAYFALAPWQNWRNLQVLRATLDEVQPNVVFIWGMWNLSRRLPAFIEQNTEYPVVYNICDRWPSDPTVHDRYWTQEPDGWAMRLLWTLPAQFARRRNRSLDVKLDFRHALCVSHYLKTRLLTEGVGLEQARVVHGAINPYPYLAIHDQPRYWSSGSKSLRILYVGGLAPHKGVHIAIQAIAESRQALGDDTRLSLDIVGSGHPDYETRLRILVRDLALDSDVTFLGRIPPNELPEVYASHDVLIFPSTEDEALGRTHLEAMASGLVVVGTIVGGSREVLCDGVNALVFAPEQASQLAARLVILARDRALCARLTEAGKATVLNHFTVTRMVDEIESFLMTLLESHSPELRSAS